MVAKLHINLSQGVLELEGDPEFVREIYSDFKDQLSHTGAVRSVNLRENEGTYIPN